MKSHIIIVCTLLCFIGCVPPDVTQTPEPSPSPVITETTTPEPSPVSPTEAPTPTATTSVLGPFVLSEQTCTLELRDGADLVIASGLYWVAEPTDDRLCAWVGSTDFPRYAYHCPADAAWQTPVPEEWSPYRIEVSYSPQTWGESPDDTICTLCAASVSCYGAP